MNIIIRNADNTPIYEQIYGQMKAAILSSQLQEGDLLPSIRSLAKDLRISVITTKRAYDELEKDGYLYSVPGKGSFVAAKNTQVMREAHLREIEQYFRKILQLAPGCQLTTGDLMEMLSVLSEEETL